MTERIQELIEKASKDFPFTVRAYVPELFLAKFAELIALECANIVYRTCRDGDAAAQAILYEFDIDNARSQK